MAGGVTQVTNPPVLTAIQHPFMCRQLLFTTESGHALATRRPFLPRGPMITQILGLLSVLQLPAMRWQNAKKGCIRDKRPSPE